MAGLRISRSLARGLPAALCLAAAVGGVSAEPYLALRSGADCASCHVNRTGGGLRTQTGATYGSRQMPRFPLRRSPGLFDGRLGDRIRLGVDYRGSYTGNFPEGGHYLGEYEIDAANLYLAFELVPERVLLYLDESVAPAGVSNREAFAMFRFRPQRTYVKVGQFFLPFGLKLQDDEAATRRFTGFNFDAIDDGIEVGARPGPLSLAASITNGSGTSGDTDNGSQLTLTASWVADRWRAGVSGSSNDLPGSDRTGVGGIHAGYRWGPVIVLGEWDAIRTERTGRPQVYSEAYHAEIDFEVLRGLTMRVWYGEFLADRDVSRSRQRQTGLGADWTPIAGVQVRVLYRERGGPPSAPGASDDEAVAQVHLYF